MPVNTCCVDGCDKPTEQKPGHQHRTCIHHRGRRNRRLCTMPGCDKPHNAKGYCKDHYDLWRYHGNPAIRLGRSDDGWIHEQGYRLLKRRGHPLARKSGDILEHRLVLWEKIGPGPHPCHWWCGMKVDWFKTWPKDQDALVVDHLDGNKLNNDPSNLAPSCQRCNYTRRAVRPGEPEQLTLRA